MKIRLNYRELILLFFPIIGCFTVGSFLFAMPSFAKTINFVLLPNMCLIISYQAYLGISFNNANANPSKLYNINALIPVVFYLSYLLYIIYLALFGPVVKHLNHGPIRYTSLGPVAIIVEVLMVHSFITYFFINTSFVSRRIRLVTDKEKQETLLKDFLTPMKKLLRITIIVIVSSIIIATASDIITYGLIPNQD